MGDIADSIIDGEFDQYTGEYLGEGCGYPRSARDMSREPRNKEKYAKSTSAIRRELAILIQEKQKTCETDKLKNKAVDDARQEMNIKYGKGWREQI